MARADAAAVADAAAPAGRARTFAIGLGVIAAGALAIRFGVVLTEWRNYDPGGDARFYHEAANLLADGKGFISPFAYANGITMPAAEHPPLYSLFLAMPSVFGLDTVLAHQLWSCIIGVGTVVLTGLIGRRVGGERVGLIAAGFAAIAPTLWVSDATLQAETLSTFFTAFVVLGAYQYWQQPSWGRLALVGAACGLGALTRSELLLLVPFVVVPLPLLVREQPVHDRRRALVIGVLVPVLLLVPWTIHNVERFEHPVLLSTQIDPLLASANCDSTYYGSRLGYFDIGCDTAVAVREGISANEDQSVQGRVYRREALEYVKDHLDRVPYVIGARLLRIVGVPHPDRFVRLESFMEGRDLWVVWSMLASFWVLVLAAIPGAVVLRRRRSVPLFPLLVPIGIVLVTVAVTYANTRFRIAAEPMLVVLAAVAIDAAFAASR